MAGFGPRRMAVPTQRKPRLVYGSYWKCEHFYFDECYKDLGVHEGVAVPTWGSRKARQAHRMTPVD